MKIIMNNEYTTKTKRFIEMEPIEGTIFVKFAETIRTKFEEECEKVKVYRGIASKEAVEKATGLNPIDCTIYAPKMYEQKAAVVEIKKSDMEKVMNAEMHISDAVHNPDKYFDSPDDYILMLWSGGAHQLADLDFEFHPFPIALDYVNGNVNNENYDLNKLLEKLKQNPRIINRDELEIINIPYYNSYRGRNKYIKFHYLPTKEEYEQYINGDCYGRYNYLMECIDANDCKIDNVD